MPIHFATDFVSEIVCVRVGIYLSIPAFLATMQMNMVRTRFAPSPTGVPHIGGTRTALFSYLFARHNKGEFILRIEDTDQKRLVKGSEETIEEILKWLGLSPDKKLKQSERLSIYKEHASELVSAKKAYEKDGAIYVHVPEDREFTWTDLVGNKNISFKGKDIEDFVILKSDGYPTYHLANVVDDHLTEITHVLRGEEWTSSTPKHLYLYELFGWEPPFFAHLPVVLGNDHTKLSKRHGAKSALDYREEGYLPEAINNYMALLGWNPGGDKEIFSIDEMIKIFDLKDINTANPVFDLQKLNWVNGVYIRSLSVGELVKRLGSKNEKLISLAQTRMNTLNDFHSITEFFSKKPKIKLDGKEKVIAKVLHYELSNLKEWTVENILFALKNVSEKEEVRMKIFYKIFTGKESGLPLPQSLEILGKEETLKRLA